MLFNRLFPFCETLYADMAIPKCEYSVRSLEKKKSSSIFTVLILYFLNYNRLWIRFVLRFSVSLYRLEVDVNLYESNNHTLNRSQCA